MGLDKQKKDARHTKTQRCDENSVVCAFFLTLVQRRAVSSQFTHCAHTHTRMPKRRVCGARKSRKKPVPVCFCRERSDRVCDDTPLAVYIPCQLDGAAQPATITLCGRHSKCEWCHKVVQNNAFLVRSSELNPVCLRSSPEFVLVAGDNEFMCGFCCRRCHMVGWVPECNERWVTKNDGNNYGNAPCTNCANNCSLCKENALGKWINVGGGEERFVCDDCREEIRAS